MKILLSLATCFLIGFIFVASFLAVSAGLWDELDTWFSNPANQFTVALCLALVALCFGVIWAFKKISRL